MLSRLPLKENEFLWMLLLKEAKEKALQAGSETILLFYAPYKGRRSHLLRIDLNKVRRLRAPAPAIEKNWGWARNHFY